MKQVLLYFGCIKDKGHYLWYNEHNRVPDISVLKSLGVEGVSDHFLHCLDETFTWPNEMQGICKESFVPPFRILAWHDRTIDTRGGSNSALIGVGYTTSQEMVAAAKSQYPSVMQRQTSPLIIKNEP